MRQTTRTNSTAHLLNPAFKPGNLITLLGFPDGSYCNPRTSPVDNDPHARTLLFSQFQLLSDIPRLPDLMKQHRIYSGYDIQVNLTKLNTLEVTLTKIDRTDSPHESNDSFFSSPRYTSNNTEEKEEYSQMRLVVKNVIGGKVTEDYLSYRSKPTYDGYAFLFAGWKHAAICEVALKNLQVRFSNFNVTGMVNNDGLYISCIRKDTQNLIPFALKELSPVSHIVEDVVAEPVIADAPVITNDSTSLGHRISGNIQSLMHSGMSIRTIQQELGCTDSDMMNMLDINSTTVVVEFVQKLGKLSNTTFTF